MTSYQLLPEHKTWKLTAEGNRVVFGGEPVKTRALACAVQIVSAIYGKLSVYGEDGTLEEERTYLYTDAMDAAA